MDRAEMIAVEMAEGAVDLGEFPHDPERRRPRLAVAAMLARDQELEEAALLQEVDLLGRPAAGLVALDRVAGEDVPQGRRLGEIRIGEVGLEAEAVR